MIKISVKWRKRKNEINIFIILTFNLSSFLQFNVSYEWQLLQSSTIVEGVRSEGVQVNFFTKQS